MTNLEAFNTQLNSNQGKASIITRPTLVFVVRLGKCNLVVMAFDSLFRRHRRLSLDHQVPFGTHLNSTQGRYTHLIAYWLISVGVFTLLLLW